MALVINDAQMKSREQRLEEGRENISLRSDNFRSPYPQKIKIKKINIKRISNKFGEGRGGFKKNGNGNCLAFPMNPSKNLHNIDLINDHCKMFGFAA